MSISLARATVALETHNAHWELSANNIHTHYIHVVILGKNSGIIT